MGTFRREDWLFRVIPGYWCILAFVLVTAYQSVLISYILTPVMQPPLVDSLADLANKSDVRLLVVKDLALDVFLTVGPINNSNW